jgi:hypothetical protein
MFIPPIMPLSPEAAKAEAEHRRKQAGPGGLMYDIQWAWQMLTFPLRAYLSWRRKRRQKRYAWAHVSGPDTGPKRESRPGP